MKKSNFGKTYSFTIKNGHGKKRGKLIVKFEGYTLDGKSNNRINDTLKNFELSMRLGVPVTPL